MENTVIYRDRQELQSGDLNNAEQYTRDSIDHVVNDAITSGPAYSGFSVTSTSATQITVAPGRFYDAGAVYPLTISTVLDTFNNLPLVTQKYVAIVTWGTDIQTSVQPRDFLLDATTGSTEPQSVAMEDSRTANLSIVAGIEAPQPSYPITDNMVTVIAYVLLNTSGIVSITQVVDNQLPNLTMTDAQVAALDLWQTQVGAQIDSLGTALANISAQLKGFATETEMQGTLAQLSALSTKVTAIKPIESYIAVVSNRFLDATGCDTGNGSWAAIVNEGIRFPAAGNAGISCVLLNALDPNAFVSSGYLIPTFTHVARITAKYLGSGGLLSISGLVYQSSVSCRQLTRRRRRHRYGCQFLPNSSSDWWKAGDNDPVSSTLAFDSESFTTVSVQNYVETINPNNPQEVTGQYIGARRNYFWEDYYSEPHWDRVTSTAAVNGQQIGQTFLNSQDGWLTQVGLFFDQVGVTGDVDIKICHVDNGHAPDLDNVICSVSVPVGHLLQSRRETKVPLPPTFLRAGRRYAIVVTTGGQHIIVLDENYAGLAGNFWYCDTGNKFVSGWGDGHNTLGLNLYYAKFAAARYEIQFQPLQLAGGISLIDILHEAEIPSACSLSFQVQIGGLWYPFDIQGSGPNLSSLPALLPFKAVFTGTADLMPGHGISNCQIKCSRPNTGLTFISTAQTLPSPSPHITIRTVLQNFNSSYHTCATKLHEGSNTHTADKIVDLDLDDGRLQRDSIFYIGAAQASDTVTFSVNPSDGATVTLNGVTVTFKTTPTGGNQVKIASGTNALLDTLLALNIFLNSSLDPNINQCSYSVSPTVLTIIYDLPGTVGNSFTVAASVAAAAHATLIGGALGIAVTTFTYEVDGTTSSATAMFSLAESHYFAG